LSGKTSNLVPERLSGGSSGGEAAAIASGRWQRSKGRRRIDSRASAFLWNLRIEADAGRTPAMDIFQAEAAFVRIELSARRLELFQTCAHRLK
jgi:hypothetical protein